MYAVSADCRLFNECPHSDDKQSEELGRILTLELMQVKFVFQNKRTQIKVLLTQKTHNFNDTGTPLYTFRYGY